MSKSFIGRQPLKSDAQVRRERPIPISGGMPMHPDLEALRVFPTAGLDHIDADNGVAVVEQGQFDYESVLPGQVNQVLGVAGDVYNFLHRVICVVTRADAAAVSIKDGELPAIALLPNVIAAGTGTYGIELNIASFSGPWQVTTAAGVSVIGVGRFNAPPPPPPPPPPIEPEPVPAPVPAPVPEPVTPPPPPPIEPEPTPEPTP